MLPSADSANRVRYLKTKAKSINETALKIDTKLSTDKLRACDEGDLKVRVSLVENTKQAFNDIHNNLEELDYNEIGSELRCDFDELLVALESRVQNEVSRRQSAMPANSTLCAHTDAPTFVVASKSRLPELKLPTFAGGYTEYADFMSMFTTIIDNDTGLSDIEKLQHLKSCLQGPASEAIRALEISSANYSVALDILNKRFNNKRLVFQAHISEILGLKRVDSSSAARLRQFSDKLNAHMRSLHTLGSPEEISGCMITYMLLQKLDAATQSSWEESMSAAIIPTCEQFTGFLERRCQRLENMEQATATYAPGSQVGKIVRPNLNKTFVAVQQTSCGFCDDAAHAIYTCSRFNNLSPPIRIKEARKLNLCLNCLKPGHQLRTCTSGSCRSCGGKHHTLLHLGNATALVGQVLQPGLALLATAIVEVKNRAGTFVPCRAIIDNGSQLHLVTSRFAHQLQLSRSKSAVAVSGLGDNVVETDGQSVCLTIRSRASDYDANILAVVTPNITDRQPSFTLDTSLWDVPANIRLADPCFFKPQRVDLLIGVSMFYDLLCTGQIRLAPGLPVIQETKLGWIVTGGDGLSHVPRVHIAHATPTNQEMNIDQLLRRFWEIESCSEVVVSPTKEDINCEDHFKANCTRLPTGAYSVRLPFKENVDLLGDSYQAAYRRFLSLERKLEPAKFNVFVANRVSSIQEHTSGMEWRYIPTSLNPADILSRGALPDALFDSDLWMHGPAILHRPQSEWPVSGDREIPLLELRKTVLLGVSPHVNMSTNCKFRNSFAKLERVFGYIAKFIRRTKDVGMTMSDLQFGSRLLIRSIQRAHLWDDYKRLLNQQQIAASSSLASLCPFLDGFGILRVGGRLKHSTLDFDARHPIILPRKHPVTHALIMHFHYRSLHSGPRSLLAAIRHQYWPIGGRKTVSCAVSKCLRCFRAKPHYVEHIMADLPRERLESSHAFMVTGVDYAGPFFYKSGVRSRPPMKCYISLFICFATKAVHLELVQDLSTPSFISALQRFILTRGRPKQIWSDNATNFVGAKNELAELKRLFLDKDHVKSVRDFCIADGIDWRFIPPRSPHFGGLWEAAIKTAKHHFYRAVGTSLLGFDELRTLVCHITAIINSRPLLPLSEHPDDLDVLTPAHFLGTAPLSTFFEPDITKLNYNRLDRWQQVSYLQQTFWARWRDEYITLLQQRSKWRRQSPGLRLGDVVLVKNENMPPLKWPLARVTNLVYGSDGVARVAELRTATGTTTRAVNNLCLLPTDDVESRAFQRGENVWLSKANKTKA